MSTTTVLRHDVSAAIRRVASVFASSSINPTGASVCVTVVLAAGIRPLATFSPAEGSRTLLTVAVAPAASAFQPATGIAVAAAAAPLFPVTVVFM